MSKGRTAGVVEGCGERDDPFAGPPHSFNVPADGLLVVEVTTPGGYWSSYPSHKH